MVNKQSVSRTQAIPANGVEQPATLGQIEFGMAQCPIGWGIDADTILSTAVSAQVAALSGQIRFMPVELGPTTQTFDAMQVVVGTAEAGGAGVVHRGGIYQSHMDGSLPNLNGGLMAEVGFTLTTTGLRLSTFSSPVAFPAARYWFAWYNYWTTQPSTFCSLTSVSAALNLPRPMNLHSSAGNRYLSISGISTSTLPNTLANPTFSSGGDSLVAQLLMRRSA